MPQNPDSQLPTTSALDIDDSAGETLSILGKRWGYREHNSQLAMAMAQRFDLPLALARIASARDITPDTLESYFTPTLREFMPDPSTVQDMDKAAALLAQTIAQGQKIGTFGDYDVDGATSTSLLRRYFRALNIQSACYIPDRVSEGYGPSGAAFANLQQQDCQVIVCVDCGITAFGPMDEAHALGLDIIIVDHHVAEPRLPKAAAIVNPNRLDDDSGLGYLAAVGVTFLLLVATNRALRDLGHFKNGHKEPNLLSLLDLVALGTVCDVVPLVDLNRAFVYQGLQVIAKRQNIGLRALSDIANVGERPAAYHLGYILGPRINAGGRIGQSRLGSDILSTEDPSEASALAMQLHEYNVERREIEGESLQEGIALAKEMVTDHHAICLSSRTWHQGIIGIMAGRIKDIYHRPTLIMTELDDGTVKGSGRSVGNIDLGSAIIAAKQSGILIAGGGHRMAAGFSLKAENLPKLQEFMNEYIRNANGGNFPPPYLLLDSAVEISAINDEFMDSLARIEPCGAHNPQPRVALHNVEVRYPRLLGQNLVRCKIQDTHNHRLEGIVFQALDQPLGKSLLQNNQYSRYDIAGQLQYNTFRKTRTIQMIIHDIMNVAH